MLAALLLWIATPAAAQLRVTPCEVHVPSHGGTYVAYHGCVDVESTLDHDVVLEPIALELRDASGAVSRIEPVVLQRDGDRRTRRTLTIRAGERVRVRIAPSARLPIARYPSVGFHVAYTQVVRVRAEGAELAIERPGFYFRYPHRR